MVSRRRPDTRLGVRRVFEGRSLPPKIWSLGVMGSPRRNVLQVFRAQDAAASSSEFVRKAGVSVSERYFRVSGQAPKKAADQSWNIHPASRFAAGSDPAAEGALNEPNCPGSPSGASKAK